MCNLQGVHKLNFLFGPAQNGSGVLSMWECYTKETFKNCIRKSETLINETSTISLSYYVLVERMEARMHSSGMRTACLLTVSQHALFKGVSQHALGRVCVSQHALGKGVCARGCLPRGCLPRGCLPGGCLPGGVCPRGCLPRGCLPGGGVADASPGPEADTSLWTEWLTDRCKNITFPQLRLRAVINIFYPQEWTRSFVFNWF